MGTLLLPLMVRADVIFSATDATWKLFKGLSEASSPDPAAWRQAAFDDTSWAVAPAPFYYTSTPTEPPFYNGGPSTGDVVRRMMKGFTCHFFVQTFVVTKAWATRTG